MGTGEKEEASGEREDCVDVCEWKPDEREVAGVCRKVATGMEVGEGDGMNVGERLCDGVSSDICEDAGEAEEGEDVEEGTDEETGRNEEDAIEVEEEEEEEGDDDDDDDEGDRDEEDERVGVVIEGDE